MTSLPLLEPDNRAVIPERCEVHQCLGWDYCIDTGLTVCYDCVFRPGLLEGIDHHLPGTTVICAHQDPPRPWLSGITAESIRYRPYPVTTDVASAVLHWGAGACWCGEFHRDQALALEFDPWRRHMSAYAARPARLG